jgi:hypothetical protein
MKRVAVLCVLAAVLGVCSQSYGYVLVYEIWGQVNAVDTPANTMNRSMVRGVLVMDIDEAQGFATEATLLLYNRAWGGQGLYTVSDAVGINIYGNSIAAVMDTSWMGGQIIMTGSIGKMWGMNIGLANRKNVANTMDGSIHLNGGTLFDANDVLVGTGIMTARLNLQATRSANMSGNNVSAVVDEIISLRLKSRGFTEFVMEGETPS